MRIRELRVKNFRSLKDTGVVTIARLQALMGENNSGKSSLLRAIEILTTGGVAGVTAEDFTDSGEAISIITTFADLSEAEARVWQPYLLNGELILEKRLWMESSARTGKDQVKSEYHGYRAEPRDWFLSVQKIESREGRPNWSAIIDENRLPEYFRQGGRATKATFQEGLRRYLAENAVEYDAPQASETEALGLQSNVIAWLPATFLLKAVADFAAETDRRSSSTTFRRLMGELADRAVEADPKYRKAVEAMEVLNALFNGQDGQPDARFGALADIERKLTSLLSGLMPSVQRLRLQVQTDPLRDVFSRGVEMRIDDGVDTDVLAKGHGLQRCAIFTLLQALILSEKRMLHASEDPGREEHRSIVLLVEEPELYIHPQLCKMFYDTLAAFAESDQVIYTTHSPLFVDAATYESICLVRKDGVFGTKVVNCDLAAFDGMTERSLFQTLTRLNPAVNELFFAKRVLLLEGPEDLIAVQGALRLHGRIRTRLEELDVTPVVVGGKPALPFFQRVLNSFRIEYAVIHDSDLIEGLDSAKEANHRKQNGAVAELAGARPVAQFEPNLEALLGGSHFKDQFEAHRYFNELEAPPPALLAVVSRALAGMGVEV